MEDHHIGLSEQIQCVRRELALRQNVYARRIRSGQMNEAGANRELMRMRAVLTTLEGLWDAHIREAGGGKVA